MISQDMLDAIAIASFFLSMKNYEENLSQSDKDDLMSKFDEQTKDILNQLNEEIEKQNQMLEKILKKLEEK